MIYLFETTKKGVITGVFIRLFVQFELVHFANFVKTLDAYFVLVCGKFRVDN